MEYLNITLVKINLRRIKGKIIYLKCGIRHFDLKVNVNDTVVNFPNHNEGSQQYDAMSVGRYLRKARRNVLSPFSAHSMLFAFQKSILKSYHCRKSQVVYPLLRFKRYNWFYMGNVCNIFK